MSASYISSSLGLNAMTSPCFSSSNACGCVNCLSFQTLSARLGVFFEIEQGDPDYTHYSNVIYQNNSYGDVVSYSTISARSGVFETVLLTSNYRDYVTSSANKDSNGIPNLYDTFVSGFGAFSSITLAPTTYTAYSTICQMYGSANSATCCGPTTEFLTPYTFNESPSSVVIGGDIIPPIVPLVIPTNQTLLSGFPFTTTASGYILAVSSMEFTNSDASPYDVNIYISINDEMPTPNTFTIGANSTRIVKMSQKNTSLLAAGTYTTYVYAFLTSGGPVTCTNTSVLVMGDLSA